MAELHLWLWRYTDEFGKQRVTRYLLDLHCKVVEGIATLPRQLGPKRGDDYDFK
jgi:hypothetical protein